MHSIQPDEIIKSQEIPLSSDSIERATIAQTMLEHSNDKLDTIWTKDEDGKDIFLPALSVSPMQVNPHHTNELTGAVDPTAASLSTLPIPALRTGRYKNN
jgi:hypothetical protein